MTRASFLSLFGKGYLDAVELRGLSKLANSRAEFANFAQISPNMLRLLNDFATRELEMAQELLLLFVRRRRKKGLRHFWSTGVTGLQASAHRRQFWRCRCGARTLPIFSVSNLKR
jgi:hypothetical protein